MSVQLYTDSSRAHLLYTLCVVVRTDQETFTKPVRAVANDEIRV